MFRKKFVGEKRETKDSIIWRGHEVTRIEAFSDAVLAFAIAGYIYILIGPSVTILYSIRNKKKRTLHHWTDSVPLEQPGNNEQLMAINKVEDDILTK